MADRPHYSTLLSKDEILDNELSVNDFTYLLRSSGAGKRDRRLKIGSLLEWIRKLLFTDLQHPVRGNGINLENPFIWPETDISINQKIRILPEMPLEVLNYFVKNMQVLEQYARIAYTGITIYNKYGIGAGNSYTDEINLSANGLYTSRNFTDNPNMNAVIEVGRNVFNASNPFKVGDDIMQSEYQLCCYKLRMINQWAADQKEIYEFDANGICLKHNAIEDYGMDLEHTVFGIRPGALLIPRHDASNRQSPPEHELTYGKTGYADDSKTLMLYAELFDGVGYVWKPYIGIGASRGKTSAGGIWGLMDAEDSSAGWKLGYDVGNGGSFLGLRITDKLRKSPTPGGGTNSSRSRAGMEVQPGIASYRSNPVRIYTERLTPDGSATECTL